MFKLEIIEPVQPKLDEKTLLEGLFSFSTWGELLPFVELRIALKWLARQLRKDRRSMIDWVELKEEGLNIVKNEELQESYLYKDMSNFKINNNSERFNKANGMVAYSSISFDYQKEPITVHFEFNQDKIVKQICQYFYDNKLPFKEYRNQERVFLGKRQNYQEVQAFKQKYDMEW